MKRIETAIAGINKTRYANERKSGDMFFRLLGKSVKQDAYLWGCKYASATETTIHNP